MTNKYFESCDEPLCAFCVSAAFFVRGVSAGEKTPSAPSGRKQFSFSIPSYPGLRPSRIYRNKSSANLLLTIAELFGNFKKRKKYLSLEEILATVQTVWQGPNTKTLCESDSDMERGSTRISSQENRSPVPQRRRLSVPETIMRKHNLALERSNFQEPKHFPWDKEMECSSDPNLNRKKDYNLMRKSTLLRRLWGDSSKPKLSGSFQEWQHSYKKLSSTQSLNSTHSSPEHMPRNRFDSTSPRRKFSSSPNRFSSRSQYEDQSAFNSPKRKIPVIENASLKALSKTPLSRESTTKYTCSSFTNVSDTNSDSAYSNSISNFTSSASSRPQRDQNSNRTSSNMRESGVQTRNVTNLNVISNVSLSQATLDVIFKEVMKDVGKLPAGDININTATITSDDPTDNVTIDKASSFFLDMNSDSTIPNLDKFVISKVRTGSPYTKPADICQLNVPRFSAVPRTSSMEVNTSEEDKEESDAVSYVDSLEDYSSPHADSQSRRSSSDVTQLLPEGKKETPSTKSSTFYIPIQVDHNKEIKSVSELLPLKVRERLNERQQKREEKSKQQRSIIQPTTKNISVIKNTLHFGNYVPKKRTKPVLPSIASLKKSSSKEKRVSDIQHGLKTKENRSAQRFYVESNKKSQENHHKRIEILEIMECVELSAEKRGKSRIPIPVSSSNGNKKNEFEKPAYLDLENNDCDPKVDQLIANILIDSLNHDLESAIKNQDVKNANIVEASFNGNVEETNRILNDPNKNLPEKNNIKSKQKNHSSSTLPKGWVTVYTVHKDLETPESTSDEGKKYLMEATEEADTRRYTEKTVTRGISKYDFQNDLFIPSSQQENPTFGSTLFHNSLNKIDNYQRKRNGRRQEEQKNSLGDWSVTISGSNSYGQMAPDVEMRLKFPKSYRTSSNSSVEKENNEERKFNFPDIGNEKDLNRLNKGYSKDKMRKKDTLPKIKTIHNKIKKREGSVISMAPSIILPRQTKTSTSRYHFSRPRERCSLPDVPSILNEKQYFEIVKRIPDLLAVTGRSISPERRLDERINGTKRSAFKRGFPIDDSLT